MYTCMYYENVRCGTRVIVITNDEENWSPILAINKINVGVADVN